MWTHFNAIDDPRQKGSFDYSQKDALMTAFAYMDVGT